MMNYSSVPPPTKPEPRATSPHHQAHPALPHHPPQTPPQTPPHPQWPQNEAAPP